MANSSSNVVPGIGKGGGGGGVYFRSPPDVFSGATLAAANTARNNYFTANADDLAEFQNDQALAIIVRVSGADDKFETYLPGNEGAAYNARQWVERVDAVQSLSLIHI